MSVCGGSAHPHRPPRAQRRPCKRLFLPVERHKTSRSFLPSSSVQRWWHREGGLSVGSSGSVPELLVADVDDLVALQAAGGLHFDGIAGMLADERAGDGRAERDAPF